MLPAAFGRASVAVRNLLLRRGGRVVEGGGLENRRRSRARGFESLPLRQWLGIVAAIVLASLPAVARPDPPAERPRVESRLARALEDPVAADAELRAQDAGRRAGTRTGELRVMLEPPRGQGADALPVAQLEALGAHVQARSRSYVRISASPAVLRHVAELGGIRTMRFPLTPVLVTGSVPSP